MAISDILKVNFNTIDTFVLSNGLDVREDIEVAVPDDVADGGHVVQVGLEGDFEKSSTSSFVQTILVSSDTKQH